MSVPVPSRVRARLVSLCAYCVWPLDTPERPFFSLGVPDICACSFLFERCLTWLRFVSTVYGLFYLLGATVFTAYKTFTA